MAIEEADLECPSTCMLMLFENIDAEFVTVLASFCRIMGKKRFSTKKLFWQNEVFPT